jgi:predicted O-methyltransferase YrrM
MSTTILEIGFNAGHSAACFLMANPNVKILCIDINTSSYTLPCFRYLKSIFNDRIYFIESNSNNLVNVLDNN